jgi:hypothetical protein
MSRRARGVFAMLALWADSGEGRAVAFEALEPKGGGGT